MFIYRAYGLNIHCEIELPELVAADSGPADLTIRMGPIDRSVPQGAIGGPEAWATSDRVFLLFDDAGGFLIKQGSQIVIDRLAGCEDRTIRLYLLGPAFGVMLHQRGFLVLHASSVLIGNSAVAFVAEKGTGKSTLAAAFHAGGHGIVADDIVAVDLAAAGGPIAHPGFPQLKLFPEAAAQLDERPEDLPRLMPDFDKRARRVVNQFPQGPVLLARIYVLQDGEREAIEPLGMQEAFMQVVRHTYVLPMLRASGTEAAHFHQAVRLVRLIPVQRLVRRRSIDVLSAVVGIVEADFAR